MRLAVTGDRKALEAAPRGCRDPGQRQPGDLEGAPRRLP